MLDHLTPKNNPPNVGFYRTFLGRRSERMETKEKSKGIDNLVSKGYARFLPRKPVGTGWGPARASVRDARSSHGQGRPHYASAFAAAGITATLAFPRANPARTRDRLPTRPRISQQGDRPTVFHQRAHGQRPPQTHLPEDGHPPAGRLASATVRDFGVLVGGAGFFSSKGNRSFSGAEPAIQTSLGYEDLCSEPSFGEPPAPHLASHVRHGLRRKPEILARVEG